jgi:hypothetical protein
MICFPFLHRIVATLVALGVLTLCAVADDKPANTDSPVPVSKTYIGTLNGAHESARIAVVVDDKGYMLYICSQDQPTNQALSRWLKGQLSKDSSFAASSTDGVKVSGAIKSDTVEGSVTSEDGKELSFQAKLVKSDDTAGLYRCEFNEDGSKCVAGWIIDSNHEIAGAVNNPKESTISASKKPHHGKTIPGIKLIDSSGKRGTLRGTLKGVDAKKNSVTLAVDGKEFTLGCHPMFRIIKQRTGEFVQGGLKSDLFLGLTDSEIDVVVQLLEANAGAAVAAVGAADVVVSIILIILFF